MLDNTGTLAKRQWDPAFEIFPAEGVDREISNQPNHLLYAREAVHPDNDDLSEDEEEADDNETDNFSITQIDLGSADVSNIGNSDTGSVDNSDDGILTTFGSTLTQMSPYTDEHNILQRFCESKPITHNPGPVVADEKLALIEESQVHHQTRGIISKWYSPGWTTGELMEHLKHQASHL